MAEKEDPENPIGSDKRPSGWYTLGRGRVNLPGNIDEAELRRRMRERFRQEHQFQEPQLRPEDLVNNTGNFPAPPEPPDMQEWAARFAAEESDDFTAPDRGPAMPQMPKFTAPEMPPLPHHSARPRQQVIQQIPMPYPPSHNFAQQVPAHSFTSRPASPQPEASRRTRGNSLAIPLIMATGILALSLMGTLAVNKLFSPATQTTQVAAPRPRAVIPTPTAMPAVIVPTAIPTEAPQTLPPTLSPSAVPTTLPTETIPSVPEVPVLTAAPLIAYTSDTALHDLRLVNSDGSGPVQSFPTCGQQEASLVTTYNLLHPQSTLSIADALNIWGSNNLFRQDCEMDANSAVAGISLNQVFGWEKQTVFGEDGIHDALRATGSLLQQGNVAYVRVNGYSSTYYVLTGYDGSNFNTYSMYDGSQFNFNQDQLETFAPYEIKVFAP